MTEMETESLKSTDQGELGGEKIAFTLGLRRRERGEMGKNVSVRMSAMLQLERF